MEYEFVRRFGCLSPLHDFLKKTSLYWIHPLMFEGLPRKSLTSLSLGVEEGLLWECKRRPWLFMSPALLAGLRGETLSNKQFAKLKEGPGDHEVMIFRVSRRLMHHPLFEIETDESIRKPSLPGAWGGMHAPQADIRVVPKISGVTPLWIECERTLKNPAAYARKLQRLRKHRVFYITNSSVKKAKLQSIFREINQEKTAVMEEWEWDPWLKRYLLRVTMSLAKDYRQVPLLPLQSL